MSFNCLSRHVQGLLIAAGTAAFLGVLGGVAVWLSGTTEPGAMVARDIFAFNRHLQFPWVLAGFLVAAYLTPRLPGFLDSIGEVVTKRLMKVKVGDIELTLSPGGVADGAALAASGETVWIAPRSMWAVFAPAHQGQLRLGKPEPIPETYVSFPKQLQEILARLESASSDNDRQVAGRKREAEHEQLWELIDRAEAGWDDEWDDHLERVADALQEMDLPDGLAGGLGRTLLFRRMMLLDIAIRLAPDDKPTRFRALSRLVECLPKLSNDVRTGFYKRPAATTLVLFLLQDGEKELLRRLEADSRRFWVDGELRDYEGGQGGFAEACHDAILYLEKDWTKLLARSPTPDKVHPTLWAVSLLVRMEALQRQAPKPEFAPRVVQLAITLLQGLPASGETPSTQLRQVAALRLCRSWPYGLTETASLVANVPEISASPACLNDLARALCTKPTSAEAADHAHRYLTVARKLVEPKSDLERVIEGNINALVAAHPNSRVER